jgi:hypothetical protein
LYINIHFVIFKESVTNARPPRESVEEEEAPKKLAKATKQVEAPEEDFDSAPF